MVCFGLLRKHLTSHACQTETRQTGLNVGHLALFTHSCCFCLWHGNPTAMWIPLPHLQIVPFSPHKPLPLSHNFNYSVCSGSRNKPTWAQLSGFLGFYTFSFFSFLFFKILIETSRTSPEDDLTIANHNKIPQESCSGNSLIFLPKNRAFLKYFSTSTMTSHYKCSPGGGG